jgi:hypothetical protein
LDEGIQGQIHDFFEMNFIIKYDRTK